MIIYGIISNKGGMLRVVESLEKVYSSLPADFPLRVFIFTDQKPFEFTSDKFVWFQVDDIEESHHEKNILKFKKDVKDYLNGEKVDWIIADFMTLEIFREVPAKICYDIHFLGRPFFESLSRYKDMHIIDTITGKNFILSLHMQHLSFVRFEAKLMKMASRFLVNSQNSFQFLLNSYQDVCNDKQIDYIPVSSELLGDDIESDAMIPKSLYFHGRCHPQKGLHFLINEKWHDMSLTIRGFEEKYLSEESLSILNRQGIKALPWTSDSKIIRKELLEHEIILFPSIYEPWGLSLQEALALGKICICHYSKSGHEEQIIDGVNGFLIDYSQKDFKERIKEICNLPDVKKMEIRNNAKKMSHLGHEKRIQALVELLKDLSTSK